MRPLLAFAVVAVLCAVLMAVTISRGFGVDLIRPGKPIAAPATSRASETRPSGPAAPTQVTLPAELSPTPLGMSSSARVSTTSTRSATGVATVEQPSVVAEPTEATVPERRAPDESSERAATRAERRAALTALTALKAQRESDRGPHQR